MNSIGGYLIIPDSWAAAIGQVFSEQKAVSLSYPEAAYDFNRIVSSDKLIISPPISFGNTKTSPLILISINEGVSQTILATTPEGSIVIVFSDGKIFFQIQTQ